MGAGEETFSVEVHAPQVEDTTNEFCDNAVPSPAGDSQGALPAMLWSEPPEPASEIQPRNLAASFSPVASPVPTSLNPCTTSKRFPATAHKRRLHCVARSLALSGAGEKPTQRMQVVLRVRPLSVKSAPEWTGQICLHANSQTTIAIVPPEKSQGYKNGDRGQTYGFSRVFESETSQEEYFGSTTSQLVSDLVKTRSAHTSVLMAYGITASGKTYTIEGTRSDPGVLPRGLAQLFQELQEQQDSDQLQVLVSHYEVYNEQVHDLLFEDVQGAAKPSLRIKEDARGHIHVAGLSKVLVRTQEEAMDVLRRGSKHRHKGGTALNHQSSRSHSIFTISLSKAAAQASNGDPPAPRERLGQLSFVDLAGSERANRTGNAGARLKESVAINSSLMTLGRCMEALRWNQQHASAEPKLVPYRESKVTHIFRDVLHGWGRLVLSVSVSPNAADYDETHNVLKYAQMATQISQLAKAELPARPQPRQVGHPCQGTAQKRRRLTALAEEPARLEIRQTLAKGAPDAEAARRASDLIEQLEDRLLDVQAENRSLQDENTHLSEQLQEAKQEAATIETSVREEVSEEMGSLLSKMDSRYKEREAEIRSQLEAQYAKQLEQAEQACQAKLDAQCTTALEGQCPMDTDTPSSTKAVLTELQQKLDESVSRASELQSEIEVMSEENRVLRKTAEEEQLKAKHATEAVSKLEASWREKLAQVEVDFAAQSELKLKLLEQRHKNGEESITEGWQEKLTQQKANSAAEVQMLDDQMQRQLDENRKLNRRVRVLSDIVETFKDCSCGQARTLHAGRGTPASPEEQDPADPGTPHAIALQRALSAVNKEAQRPSLGPASASPAPAAACHVSARFPSGATGAHGPEHEARQSLMRSSQLLSRLQGPGRSSLADEMPSCMKALRAAGGSPGSEPDGNWDEPDTSPVVLEEDVRASTGVFTRPSSQPTPMEAEPPLLRASAPQLHLDGHAASPSSDDGLPAEPEQSEKPAAQQLSLHSSLKDMPLGTPARDSSQKRHGASEEHPAVSALKANLEKIRKKRRLSRLQKELAWASEINEDVYYKPPLAKSDSPAKGDSPAETSEAAAAAAAAAEEEAPVAAERKKPLAGGRRRSTRVAKSATMSASGSEDSDAAPVKDRPVRRARKSAATSGRRSSTRSRNQPVSCLGDGLEAIMEDCEAAQTEVPNQSQKVIHAERDSSEDKTSTVAASQGDKENTPNGSTAYTKRGAQFKRITAGSPVDTADLSLRSLGNSASKPRRRRLGKGTALLSVTSELNEEPTAAVMKERRASRRV